MKQSRQPLETRPRTERGQFDHRRLIYGQSALGAPLFYFPADACDGQAGLVMAGTHGDEVASVVALSCALRSLCPGQLRHHVILAVNPDGCQLGTRSNARGVDLNRNFSTHNWNGDGTVYRWNSAAEERDVRLSTGESAASEPETRALCHLIRALAPTWMVSIHEPLACVEDPCQSPLGHWLAEQLELPLVTELGYPTPGSFGTWCADNEYPCITLEFPPISADAASEDYLPALMELLVYPH
ncbi:MULTISPECIES: murein tripeptide amidase MpaA [Microbulbifer]|uniref:Murein peptide amidase A n=1 Tax=Microbulbifer celer TaxID=435905 RepID=A0ABW3UA69_9GAMM|nr:MULTISPECIES: murein tripeptide amidase MpaA [Microbulbifer]UFN58447.1 murein tripeptide amidase MpaA [Microbulbifer celer]